MNGFRSDIAPAAARRRARAIDRSTRPRAAVRSGLLFSAIASFIAGPAHADDSWARAGSSSASVDRLVASGVPVKPLRHALNAVACARSRGLVEGSTLTLIDYSQPSDRRRLWVVDLDAGHVRFHEYVTHGRGSGDARSIRFSNEEGSHQSSLGLFRTAETYVGRHGYSLRLDGLEAGVNDRARDRAIVIHGAEYATGTVARHFGRLGRSWGCPAIDPAVHRALIDGVRGGTAVFAYYPDADWLADSPYQSCEPESETTTASR